MFFSKSRKQSVEAAPYLRRLIDLTTPNLPTQGQVARVENRYNRTLPVLVTRWTEKAKVDKPILFGVTKDISDQGFAIVLNQATDLDSLLMMLWPGRKAFNQPLAFVGIKRREQPLGGGFWLLGVEVIELANEAYQTELQKLMPLAETLCPQVESSTKT